jgi:hypothetical protein
MATSMNPPRFWDSSALVPLVVEEPASLACRRELRADSLLIGACGGSCLAGAARAEGFDVIITPGR